MSRHRHILIRDIGFAPAKFEAPSGRGGDMPAPVEDRAGHAANLARQLDEISFAFAETVSSQSLLPSSQRGVAIVATAREGISLVAGSGRSSSRGIKILNTRRRATRHNAMRRSEALIGAATLFLNRNSLKGLSQRVRTYGSWVGDPNDEFDTEESDSRPQNFWLFESTQSFRPAGLEDYWTDQPSSFPAGRGPNEWEVWVRESLSSEFLQVVEHLDLRTRGRPSTFNDIKIFNIFASRRQMRQLIEASAAVVELRGASDFDAEEEEFEDGFGPAPIRSLRQRITIPPLNAPVVTLLDTGVHRTNPLLKDIIAPEQCLTIRSAYDPFDADGHGTKMAGVALFGDLNALVSARSSVALEHGLESVAIFSSAGRRLPARDAIRRGVETAEGRVHPRVFCLAATAVGEAEDGRPTSTSSTMDELAFNNGSDGRLFCVAVGNVATAANDPYRVSDYDSLNSEHRIQSPAQALNVLSVGAVTQKCASPAPLAESGDLSPRSRTAQQWDWVARNCKPDILMEGGNHSVDPCGTTSRPHVDDMILTTSRLAPRQSLTLTGDTSAAAAAAARLSARLMSRYPALRAETVRGLLVHCAEWTEVMLQRHSEMISEGWPRSDAWMNILDCFGWGVPNEERLFWSADNALTLIVEDSLEPYCQGSGSSIKLNEMKSFRMPWPEDALRALRGEEVEMRCTLSYFIDPDPHSASLDRANLYPSHRLKFDLQRSEETEERAWSRVNRAVQSTDMKIADDGWLLGSINRARGTLHHDIWRGPATDLIGRQMFSVCPIRGWWAARALEEAANRPIRFSLIVSIRTARQDIDVYSSAAVNVPAGVRVDVPSLVNV